MNRNANGKPEYAASGLLPENVKRITTEDAQNVTLMKDYFDHRTRTGKANYLRRTGRGKMFRLR